MGTIVAVTSGKGGTGKTTSAAAISSCLAALGHKTIAVDADAGLRNLDISLAASDFAVSDVTDVTEGRASVLEASKQHPLLPNLSFLAAPAVKSPEDIDPKAFEKMMFEAKNAFDYVVVDSPAGLGAGFKYAAQSADLAIIVTTGDMSSVRDASKTVETLYSMGIGNCRLLINRVINRLRFAPRIALDDIIDDTGARLIGVVREDASVRDAVFAEKPLILYATHGAVNDYLDIARRIRGEDIPLK